MSVYDFGLFLVACVQHSHVSVWAPPCVWSRRGWMLSLTSESSLMWCHIILLCNNNTMRVHRICFNIHKRNVNLWLCVRVCVYECTCVHWICDIVATMISAYLYDDARSVIAGQSVEFSYGIYYIWSDWITRNTHNHNAICSCALHLKRDISNIWLLYLAFYKISISSIAGTNIKRRWVYLSDNYHGYGIVPSLTEIFCGFFYIRLYGILDNFCFFVVIVILTYFSIFSESNDLILRIFYIYILQMQPVSS